MSRVNEKKLGKGVGRIYVGGKRKGTLGRFYNFCSLICVVEGDVHKEQWYFLWGNWV